MELILMRLHPTAIQDLMNFSERLWKLRLYQTSQINHHQLTQEKKVALKKMPKNQQTQRSQKLSQYTLKKWKKLLRLKNLFSDLGCHKLETGPFKDSSTKENCLWLSIKSLMIGFRFRVKLKMMPLKRYVML